MNTYINPLIQVKQKRHMQCLFCFYLYLLCKSATWIIGATNNAHIESLSGSFRDECLHTNWFMSLEDAQEKIERAE